MLELNDFIEITAPKEEGIGQYTAYMDARRQINIVSSYCIENEAPIDFKIIVDKNLKPKFLWQHMRHQLWYIVKFKHPWVKPYLEQLFNDFVNNNKDNFKWFFRDKRKKENKN